MVFEIRAHFTNMCSLVFENAKEKLNNAIVVIDKSGNLNFEINWQNICATK